MCFTLSDQRFTIIEFHTNYPNIELSIFGLRTGDIFNKLFQNELDLGIVFLPIDDNELETVPLFEEELALAVHADHPIATNNVVTLEILKETPSILLPNTYYIRQLINKTCEEFGFTPCPVMEMTTMESIINMVNHQMGVTILSTAYLNYINHSNIKIIPIVEPKLKTKIGIVYRKNKYLCTASRVFIDKLVTITKNKQ